MVIDSFQQIWCQNSNEGGRKCFIWSFGIGAGANMGRGNLLGGAIPGMNTGVVGGINGSFGPGVRIPISRPGSPDSGSGAGGSGGIAEDQGFGGGDLGQRIRLGGDIGTGNTGLGNVVIGVGIGVVIGGGGLGGIGNGGVGEGGMDGQP
ncbi:hypothetical protein Lser_V15G09716 [Lactuca serriola]